MLNNEVQLLHEAIAAVCPIAGVSIGSKTFDRAKVRIDFDQAATAQQRADAQAVVASFDPASVKASLDAGAAQVRVDKDALKDGHIATVERLQEIAAISKPDDLTAAVRDIAAIQLKMMAVIKGML